MALELCIAMKAKTLTHSPASGKAEPPKGRQALPDEIAGWLVDAIEKGSLAPGDRLPSERQLSGRFSVSRAVVREALSQLKNEGLIVVQQGRGAFVSERGRRQAFQLQRVSLEENAALAHVVELLVAIEVGASRLAAARRTDEDLKRVKRALVGMEYAIASERVGDEEDFAFHQAITDATRNPHFQTLNEYLENSVRRLIRRARTNTASQDAALVQAVQEEHKAIYEGIASGDPDAAGAAAETHLRNAAIRLRLCLDSDRRKRKRHDSTGTPP